MVRDQDEFIDDFAPEEEMERPYEIVVVSGSGLTLAVLDGCGHLTANAPLRSEPQAFWSAAMTVFATVARVCGWAPDDLQRFAAEAAFVSVAEDGRILQPAALTRAELDREMAAVLRAIPDDYALPRSGPEPGLAAAAQRLTEAMSPDEPGFVLAVLVTADVSSHRRVDAGTGELSENLVKAVRDEGFRLYEEIGDDRTGRLTGLIIEGRDGACRIEPVFDRPVWTDNTTPDKPPFWWRSVVVPMAHRDPAWHPAWLPAAIDLLRQAGLTV